MQVKVQAHVAYQTQYHVVWIPKWRKEVLVSGVREYLERILQTTIHDKYPDVYIAELNIQPDYVHALIEIPPKYAVSTIIGYVKGVSSRLLRRHFDYLQHAPSLWGVGFFASTVGINEQTIKKYIKYQDKQERGQTLLEEFALT
jgi:putative transposase